MPTSSTPARRRARAKARKAAAIDRLEVGRRVGAVCVGGGEDLARAERRAAPRRSRARRCGRAPRRARGGARCRARRAGRRRGRSTASSAAVEPLPLVPATRTAGKRRSGWPSAASSARKGVEAEPDAGRSSARAMQPRQAGLGGHSAARWRRQRATVAFSSARWHDEVEEAVLEQELAALEPFGKALADRLLDDARAGEADQRAGLGDVEVAEHGEAGGDAAGGRVGEHRDVGHAGVAQAGERRRDLGHLHQRQDALLHARAAGGRDDDQRAAASRPRARRRGRASRPPPSPSSRP